METNNFLKQKKWTEYLLSLKPGRPVVAVLETYRDLESLRNIAWRLNARGENGRRYSIQSDYSQTSLVITVTDTKEKV